MSPKPADPRVRSSLVEHAARLLAHPDGLTIRRLAAEVGTSTMAVYTHFGGMEDLRRAVRREGFTRLAQHMDSVSATRDPVADLSSLGAAYCINAITNPDLYRAMFLEAPIDADDEAVGAATFEPVIAAVERCMGAGRFAPADPKALAVQLWSMTHGMVTLAIAGLLTVDELLEHLTAMARSLYVGYGDRPEAAAASIERARKRAIRAPVARVR